MSIYLLYYDDFIFFIEKSLCCLSVSRIWHATYFPCLKQWINKVIFLLSSFINCQQHGYQLITWVFSLWWHVASSNNKYLFYFLVCSTYHSSLIYRTGSLDWTLWLCDARICLQSSFWRFPSYLVRNNNATYKYALSSSFYSYTGTKKGVDFRDTIWRIVIRSVLSDIAFIFSHTCKYSKSKMVTKISQCCLWMCFCYSWKSIEFLSSLVI